MIMRTVMMVMKMLKPLVEKRRRDRINKNLEELRLLLLQKTHCQTLKNPKVEKAEILEIAVGYLQERNQAAVPQGANPSEDDGNLRTCYAMGFRACFGHLESFVRRSPPSVQRHLWETLHVYLAATLEPSPPDWTPSTFSPSSTSEESTSGSPKAPCSPLQPNRTFASSDVASCSTGHLGGQMRDPRAAPSVKNISLHPPFWRPWP
ncbi:transcription factor HES-7 [Ahaetulla prasina]|uniref:transcription factor HES-7 n=1 Tax=Ahaetulla prasina TaxID=499056 RepID=UPI002647CADA|nr:transcription factor HES-7 [Ahaetulla prasina]